MLLIFPGIWTGGGPKIGQLGKRLMVGAKRIVRFWGWKTYHRARSPKPVLEASESGICLVSRVKTNGGKTYHRWGGGGGPGPFLGRGFVACFALS